MTKTKPDYLEILKNLIAFDTTSSKSNLPLIDYLYEFLQQHHFNSRIFYNDDKTKANLFASIGPDVPGGCMLAGHTDVVPVEGQPWDSPPFTLVEQGDRLIGRGTSDMKGFIALVCDVVRAMNLSALEKPMYLAFTYDEEVGCFGAKALQAELAKHADFIEFALIGEPTDFALVNSHKGVQLTKTNFTGKPAHSSCPHLGHNAIMAAAHFLQNLPSILPRDENHRFHPATSTMNAGTIAGGNACNIIAEHCQLDWECRPLPGIEIERLNHALNDLTEQISAETQVKIKNEPLSFVPGLLDNDNQAVIHFLKSFLPDDTPVTTAPFVTEAGLFQQASIPTVVFGPGELEQAHQPNESISKTKMDDFHSFLVALLKHFCH